MRTGGLGVRAQNLVVQEGIAQGDGAVRAAHKPGIAQELAKQGEQTPKEIALSEPRSAIHLHRCQQVCPSAYVLPNGLSLFLAALNARRYSISFLDITVLTPPVERYSEHTVSPIPNQLCSGRNPKHASRWRCGIPSEDTEHTATAGLHPGGSRRPHSGETPPEGPTCQRHPPPTEGALQGPRYRGFPVTCGFSSHRSYESQTQCNASKLYAIRSRQNGDSMG